MVPDQDDPMAILSKHAASMASFFLSPWYMGDFGRPNGGAVDRDDEAQNGPSASDANSFPKKRGVVNRTQPCRGEAILTRAAALVQ